MMSRQTLRSMDRRGKRRTKPPVPHVKSHLPGDHDCTARQAFLMAAVDGKKDTNWRHYIAAATPCSQALHPDFPGWSK